LEKEAVAEQKPENMTFMFLNSLRDGLRLDVEQALKMYLKDLVQITGDLSTLLLRDGTVYFPMKKKSWKYVDQIIDIAAGKDFLLALTAFKEAIYYHITSERVKILQISAPDLISTGLQRYFVQGGKRGHHLVLAGGISSKSSLGTVREDAMIACGFEEPVTVNSGPTQPLDKLQDVQSISCGPSHTAIVKDTRLAVFGDNHHGQLGLAKRRNVVKFAEFVDFQIPILQDLCIDNGIFVRDHRGNVWFAGLLGALSSPDQFTLIPLKQVATALYSSTEGSLLIAHEIGASAFGYNKFNNFGISDEEQLVDSSTRITSLNGMRVTNAKLIEKHSLVMATQTKEVQNIIARYKNIIDTIVAEASIFSDIDIISNAPKNNKKEHIITYYIPVKEEKVVVSAYKKRKSKDSELGPLKKRKRPTIENEAVCSIL
jgi:alpha-tubulin suppressor-like RCC1 family protein